MPGEVHGMTRGMILGGAGEARGGGIVRTSHTGMARDSGIRRIIITRSTNRFITIHTGRLQDLQQTGGRAESEARLQELRQREAVQQAEVLQ